MAMPNLSHADLEKLKFFINFVSENPTVLNLPQLQFVKDFLEKFGGKVPTGEFKMPTGAAGGKCPFGGDAAGGSGMNVDESEESELEDSDPESEVELDLEAKTKHKRKRQKRGPDLAPRSIIDDNFINTSAVYLEETNVIRKQEPIKTERENSDCEQNNIEEFECQVEAVYDNDEGDNIDEEDPIETNAASVTLKFELDSDCENDDLHDENYKEVEDDSDSDESAEMVSTRRETRSCKRKLGKKKSHTKNRNFYTELKPEKKVRKPKPVNCNGKCRKECVKIDEDQRLKLCKQFWSLGFVERKNYLLTCIEKKPLGKMRIIKRVKEARQHTNHYFMPTGEGGRVRVCLDFFLKTLVISGYLVKDALENNDGKGHYTGTDLRGGSGEGRRLKSEIAKQKRDCSMEDIVSSVDNSVIEEAREQVDHVVRRDITTTETDVLNYATHELGEQNEHVEENETEENRIEKISSIATQETKRTDCLVVLSEPSEPTEPMTSTVAKIKSKSNNRPSRKGIPVKKDRIPQPVNCAESCRFKCHTKFTEEQRSLLCAAFWRLSYKRRKDFVLSRVEVHENTSTTAAEHRKTNRVRVYTNRYFLRGERGENVRVCSRFFNTTLCIGSHFLANAQKNVDKQTGAYAGEDRRGRTAKKNKISDELVCGVREHINSYPTWVPHKSYKTRFLHSSLNIVKMYAEYKVDCERQNKAAVSPSYFRRVFHKDFKLAFLQPTSKHAHKVSSQRKSNEATKSDSGNNLANANVDNALLGDSTIVKGNSSVPATKKLNPNISTFTGEEGGFWTQLTPNATETMRFLQQRYAPQAPTSVIMPTIYHHQQQLIQTPPSTSQTSQMQQQQQQQPQHLPPALMPTSAYQLVPQAGGGGGGGYVHQPHIMNAGYESEERAQNFHML